MSDEDPATADADLPSFPGPGETILRIADFPPDSVYPDEADSVIFSEIDGHEEAEAGAEHSNGKHFWFHRTDSLDYAVVLDGEITLLVDEGETTLRARRRSGPAGHQPRLVQPHRPDGPHVVRADRNRAPVGG